MCNICVDSKYLDRLQEEILRKKYTQVFTFFFSKSINEILQNKSLHHVVVFKEFLFYDDDEEYISGWANTSPSQFATQQHYQPLLGDLASYKKVRTVFQISRKPQKAPHKSRARKIEPTESAIINGSFVADMERQLSVENASFETTKHDIYDPQFSSDQSPTPEKKAPKISHLNDIPRYVFDSKLRKCNPAVKRSFETSSLSYKQLQRASTRSFKSFLNMQILENVLTRGSTSMSRSGPSSRMIDVKQFYESLQNNQSEKKEKRAETQPTAVQMYKKLQACYDEKKPVMNPQQQKSLKSLLQKYQKYISVSPISKSPAEKLVSKSLRLSANLQQEQQLLYGFQKVQRKISFGKKMII